MLVGMTTLNTSKRHSLWIDSEPLYCLRFCISVPSSDFFGGHPSRLNCSTLKIIKSLADSWKIEELLAGAIYFYIILTFLCQIDYHYYASALARWMFILSVKPISLIYLQQGLRYPFLVQRLQVKVYVQWPKWKTVRKVGAQLRGVLGVWTPALFFKRIKVPFYWKIVDLQLRNVLM